MPPNVLPNRLTDAPLERLRRGLDARGALQSLVTAAPRLVRGCDEASVTIVRGRQVRTVSSSSTAVVEADSLQQRLGQGPLLYAAPSARSTAVLDLSRETRWPAWSWIVSDALRLTSMVSIRALDDARSGVTLTLWSTARSKAEMDEGEAAVLAAMSSYILVSDGDRPPAGLARVVLEQFDHISRSAWEAIARRARYVLAGPARHALEALLEANGGVLPVETTNG